MKTDIAIKSKFGFGTELIGKQYDGQFRSELTSAGLYANEEYVKYLFVIALFLPLFPLKCLRMESYYTQECFEITKQERIKGEEHSKFGEVLHIYLLRGLISIPLIPFLIISSCLNGD